MVCLVEKAWYETQHPPLAGDEEKEHRSYSSRRGDGRPRGGPSFLDVLACSSRDCVSGEEFSSVDWTPDVVRHAEVCISIALLSSLNKNDWLLSEHTRHNLLLTTAGTLPNSHGYLPCFRSLCGSLAVTPNDDITLGALLSVGIPQHDPAGKQPSSHVMTTALPSVPDVYLRFTSTDQLFDTETDSILPMSLFHTLVVRCCHMSDWKMVGSASFVPVDISPYIISLMIRDDAIRIAVHRDSKLSDAGEILHRGLPGTLAYILDAAKDITKQYYPNLECQLYVSCGHTASRHALLAKMRQGPMK